MPGRAEVDQLLDGMVDDLFEDGLTALEQRRELEQEVRVADDIERDLAANGPFFEYLKHRRAEALTALQALAAVDPRDAVAVAMTQAVVSEYLRPCHWIAVRRQTAASAARTIKEDYPADGQQPERDEQD